MKKRSIISVVVVAVSLSLLYGNISYAGRQWNNPENEKRYKNALRQSAEAHQNAATAWGNYDRELGRAQKDVRRVRDEAIKGAIKGGPAGAAWGAAKGENNRYLLLRSDEDPVIKGRAIRSVNINEFPDIIIQALNDPSCQVREAALKKLIELDDDLYAKKLEQDVASLLAVENHDDVLISILEYYDYYYFSEPQSIMNIGAQLISKSELSEDVLIHIIKILSSYDLPTDSIDHLVTSSSSFLNLSLSKKEIAKKRNGKIF